MADDSDDDGLASLETLEHMSPLELKNLIAEEGSDGELEAKIEESASAESRPKKLVQMSSLTRLTSKVNLKEANTCIINYYLL